MELAKKGQESTACKGGVLNALVSSQNWEVLNGVGVDGVGVVFPFFYAFSPFLHIFSVFFIRFSSLFSSSLKGQGRTINSNLLQKLGISLRPRLHRPGAKLPDKSL